jgi:N-acetylneuraminate synthase
MNIGENIISKDGEPLIIAELSGNHNGSLDRALQLVDAAAESGIKAIKLQTYTADTITIDSPRKEFSITDKKSLWNGRTLYSLYEEAHTPWEWQKEIFDRAVLRGMVCFSSVFDESSVDFLEALNCPVYKIASQECIHTPLIKYVARTGKPIIISTGMASIGEIDQAINAFSGISSAPYSIMKCTSQYPADPRNSNVLTIPYMRKLFGCEVGLSDHTLGIGASLAAIAHGATFIEKHITLNRGDGGVDSAFSLEPNEFKSLNDEAHRVRLALGDVVFGPAGEEVSSMQGRRSIYVVKDISAGEKFTSENIRVIRPSGGLEPINMEIIIGKSAGSNIKRGTPLDWDLVG